MGEKIKAAKLEFGEAEKKREALKLSAFFPVLNRIVSVHLSHQETFKTKDEICRCIELEIKNVWS